MKKRSLSVLSSVAVLFLSALHVVAQVPGIITYQGVLESNGNKYNGAGQFKFALVNDGQPDLTTFWSNDGTLDGTEPADHVVVNVDKGLFTVALGDTTLDNMASIPVSVFSNPNVHLRIWFNDGNAGFSQLIPDQRLTAVGYAMMAANVADGAISAAKLADGSITTAKLADGAVTSIKIAPVSIHTTHLGDGIILTDKIANAAVTTVKLADGAVTAAKLAPGAVSSDQIINNSITSADIADVLTLQTLNLGGVSWDGALNLFAKPSGGGGGIINPAGEVRAHLLGDQFGSEFKMFFGNATTGAVLSSRAPGGMLKLWDGLASPTVVLGTMVGGGDLTLFQINGKQGIRLDGDRATYDNQTSAGGEISIYNQGGLQAGVFLDGEDNGGGLIEVRNQLGVDRILLRGVGAGGGGELGLQNATGARRVTLLGEDSKVRLFGAGNALNVELRGEDGNVVATSRVGVAAATDASVLQASLGLDSNGGLLRTRDEHDATTTLIGANTAGGFMTTYQGNGEVGVQVFGTQPGGSGGRLEMFQASGGAATVVLDGEVGNGGGGYLQLRKGDGTGTITLDSDSAGEGRITTQVLQITGGSDLSERFEVQPTAGVLEPGMVVCIDPANPAHLAVSGRPYDRTVAGIISGAGGVKPGLLMGQAGTVADGKHPVALTGRVYCLVDATEASVEPGDLITTSSVPGHGMKAVDALRSHGAIIGKAMTPLARGKGLVLVLVSLQ